MNSNLTVAIHEFTHSIDTLHNEFAAGHSITVMGLLILHQLYQQDGQKASQLAAAVGRAATSFTPIIDTLERAGLVCRKPSKRDRRAVHIYLTDEGQALRKSIVGHMDAVETRLHDLLSARIWSVKTVDALFAPLPETQAS